MEEIDRAIVAALTADGRLSYTDLAEKVGLSVSAVHQRVRRLEQRGVIKGYAARVSFEALDLPLTAFVAIRPFDPSQPDDAPERLAHLPEIDSCYSVAGEDFYLLLVRVAEPGRPGAGAAGDPHRGERHHPHDGGAVHPVRGPPAEDQWGSAESVAVPGAGGAGWFHRRMTCRPCS